MGKKSGSSPIGNARKGGARSPRNRGIKGGFASPARVANPWRLPSPDASGMREQMQLARQPANPAPSYGGYNPNSPNYGAKIDLNNIQTPTTLPAGAEATGPQVRGNPFRPTATSGSTGGMAGGGIVGGGAAAPGKFQGMSQSEIAQNPAFQQALPGVIDNAVQGLAGNEDFRAAIAPQVAERRQREAGGGVMAPTLPGASSIPAGRGTVGGGVAAPQNPNTDIGGVRGRMAAINERLAKARAVRPSGDQMRNAVLGQSARKAGARGVPQAARQHLQGLLANRGYDPSGMQMDEYRRRAGQARRYHGSLS